MKKYYNPAMIIENSKITIADTCQKWGFSINSDNEKIKIIIVEDQTILREALAKTIGLFDELELVGCWESGEEAIAQLKKKTMPFDLAIIDKRLPGIDGFKTLKNLKKEFPDRKYIVLSMYLENDDVFKALDSGATGVIPKSVSIEELISAIRSVSSGGTYIAQEVLNLVVNNHNKGKEDNDENEGLNDTHLQILELSSKGLSNREISERLTISEPSVKHYWRVIFDTLKVKNKTEAVARALKSGLID